jgi:hypothetical protein
VIAVAASTFRPRRGRFRLGSFDGNGSSHLRLVGARGRDLAGPAILYRLDDHLAVEPDIVRREIGTVGKFGDFLSSIALVTPLAAIVYNRGPGRRTGRLRDRFRRYLPEPSLCLPKTRR